MRDYHLQFGIQYGYDINRDNRVTAGLTFSPGKTLLGHAWGLNYDMTQTSNKADTVGYTSLRHKYTPSGSVGEPVSTGSGARN